MHLLSPLYLRAVLPWTDKTVHAGLPARWRRYEALERRSLQQNLDEQWQSLQRLLRHAYETVPFYKQRFDAAGMDPHSFKTPEDVQRLPLLTRDDIRANYEPLRSRRFTESELFPAATGGTTSNPVPFLRSRESLQEKNTLQLRFDAWADLYPGDKIFYVWGAVQDFAQDPSWRWRLYDRYLMRRVWAPTSLFNEQVLEGYLQMFRSFRPHAIYAYPTPLALFCEYLRDKGGDFPRPKSVICTAEPLFRSQREIIESVLACKVFEQYGAREFGMIGAECEAHAGLHINPAAAFVEYVPVPDSSEELYEVIVTDLLNYGMPLIRYRIDDCAVPRTGACSCGRGYPMMSDLAGRTTDVFYLPDGSKVPGVSLTNRVAKLIPGVEQMQVVQEKLEEIRVRYVPGEGFKASDLDFLSEKLRNFFPPPVQFVYERVDQIPREKSGKTRFCICRVGGMKDQATPQAQGD